MNTITAAAASAAKAMLAICIAPIAILADVAGYLLGNYAGHFIHAAMENLSDLVEPRGDK